VIDHLVVGEREYPQPIRGDGAQSPAAEDLRAADVEGAAQAHRRSAGTARPGLDVVRRPLLKDFCLQTRAARVRRASSKLPHTERGDE
jgi:hypothetical protein